MPRGSSKRAVRYGVIAAVAVMVIAAAASYVYARSTGALSKVSSADNLVIVLASTGEDGAELASVVALVTQGGAKVHVLDPLMRVTIPGTSYTQLRDAYPFGGAAAVAAALGAEAGDKPGWVDVRQAAWVTALGTTGVPVHLPKPIDVFDGTRLASFPEGTSTVAPADVALLLRGLAYLPADQRTEVVERVGAAAIAALAAHTPTSGVTTNLTTDTFTQLLSRLRQP